VDFRFPVKGNDPGFAHPSRGCHRPVHLTYETTVRSGFFGSALGEFGRNMETLAAFPLVLGGFGETEATDGLSPPLFSS
jgi:hypothetical protein